MSATTKPPVHIYVPSDPDPLRDGLLRGFWAHRAALAAPAVTEDAKA